ncbi:MAG: MBL fold metallo-hydrolase [Planctomycetaceae bacterium]|jgi:beta-lactamase superfamily II metal-dependent hydrolase|nr:MBL fold metallo-hydrolase [Planctomycetaceae bacterium]
MTYQLDRRNFLSVVGTATLGADAALALAEDGNKQFSDWQEGWLDIHHIATGMGNATYIICPDGTTMLIDTGDVDRPEGPQKMPPVPNDSKTAGEWVADYIRRFSKPLKQATPTLDYVLLTHFHADHIGRKLPSVPEAHGYALSGISMLAEHVDIKKIVDRGYPDYEFPSRKAVVGSNPSYFNEYLKFVEYQQQTRKTTVECFEPGSNSQFVLKNKPSKYAFNVQNIHVNGKIWTGEGTNTQTLFTEADKPDENRCSTSLKLTYGGFKYFSGGDTVGSPGRDVETPISEVVGQVDTMIMNHHAQIDATNAHFLSKLRPQVMVISAWNLRHPHPQKLPQMVDKTIYPDDRQIFTTGMYQGIRDNLGESVNDINPSWGHVVIRAYEDGKKFQVFVLDAETEKFEVKYCTGLLTSK